MTRDTTPQLGQFISYRAKPAWKKDAIRTPAARDPAWCRYLHELITGRHLVDVPKALSRVTEALAQAAGKETA
jgi:hypothetical protein